MAEWSPSARSASAADRSSICPADPFPIVQDHFPVIAMLKKIILSIIGVIVLIGVLAGLEGFAVPRDGPGAAVILPPSSPQPSGPADLLAAYPGHRQRCRRPRRDSEHRGQRHRPPHRL
jgi:hypothetical protein